MSFPAKISSALLRALFIAPTHAIWSSAFRCSVMPWGRSHWDDASIGRTFSNWYRLLYGVLSDTWAAYGQSVHKLLVLPRIAPNSAGGNLRTCYMWFPLCDNPFLSFDFTLICTLYSVSSYKTTGLTGTMFYHFKTVYHKIWWNLLQKRTFLEFESYTAHQRKALKRKFQGFSAALKRLLPFIVPFINWEHL